MNIAILDVRKGNRDPKNSITISYRNLLELKRELSADLFVSIHDINFIKHYDVIICGFGSTSTEAVESTKFINKNKSARIIWLVGEYEQSTFAPLFYSKRRFDVVKNFEHNLKHKNANKQYLININTLIVRKPNKQVQKKYDCLYWGRWRPGREKYFKEYLQEGVYLSTSSKNMKKFIFAGCNPLFLNSMKWDYKREALNNFRYSIYLEDEFTHNNYNCLANRYYEALFCNVVQFFDISCANTIKKSLIDLDHFFIVQSKEELISKINSIDYNEMMIKQKNLQQQAVSERSKTINEIRNILTT